MAYEMREGEFTLFKNNDKEPDSKQPDYTGKIMVGGEIKRLAAWVKEGKGGKFFSGKVSEPMKGRAEVREIIKNAFPDDTIPF